MKILSHSYRVQTHSRAFIAGYQDSKYTERKKLIRIQDIIRQKTNSGNTLEQDMTTYILNFNSVSIINSLIIARGLLVKHLTGPRISKKNQNISCCNS